MEVFIKNLRINPELAQVSSMNYGQMQRWEDFVPLTYSIKMDSTVLSKKIASFFADFRSSEMQDDDTDGIPELVAYKKAGWPDLQVLMKDQQNLIRDLLIYNQHDVLQLILPPPTTTYNYCYSINSVEEVLFEGSLILLKGICFQSDYLEHTYNHKGSRKHALLKDKD